MSHPVTPSSAFNAAHAAVYDQQNEPLRAIKDGLHLLIRVQFAHLPADARILVAGAGTGAEARFLAPLFPGWRFTLVDPAEAMLDVARQHAATEGFADRCTFHTGLVDSLPADRHDAATSVLVSHFITDADERQAYFGSIAARLKPGAPLFNADLCADRTSATFEPLMDLWLDMRAQASGQTAASQAPFRAAFGRELAVQGPEAVEALIRRAGFQPPVACFQALLIRGWATNRSAELDGRPGV